MSLPSPVWMPQALLDVEGSGLGNLVRNSPYVYPVMMALHVIGIALLLGPVFAVDLRLLGMARNLVPVTVATRCLLPLAHIGFILVALTGVGMFFGIASTVWASEAAPWKFGLIAVAGINLLMFHFGPFRGVKEWDTQVKSPPAARASAVVSAICWTSTVFAGRMLAY